jgi:hypothetical protein
VFGRRGARPLNRAETERLYLRDGQLYTVVDEPVERPYSSGLVSLLTRARDWLKFLY